MNQKKPPSPGASPDAALFQKTILKWYDQYQRDLPWRNIQNPYATFVSEMMLQQTQVKTVLPYYGRFLKELPDWKALAGAKEEKVLKLWEGLGYYRRARSLQAAAKKVMTDYGGKLPDTLEEILELPGVGPYSAGAILSIAYQKPIPLVDGNVIRVFSRIFVLRGNLKSGEGHQRVWELARSLVPSQRPGDFNQALMELGATVCFSENPQCLLCPMMSQCEASQRGIQNELPEMPKQVKSVEIPMAALLAEQNREFLVKKRTQDEKWLKGMWEFPSAEGKNHEEARKNLEQILKMKMEPREIREVRHQITHHKISLKLFKALPLKKKAFPRGYRWVSAAELMKLPFSSAQAKLRKWVLEDPFLGQKSELDSGPLFKTKTRKK